MAVSNVIDITSDFNSGSSAVIDIGGWDFAVAQFVGPSGTINFTHSNDSGDITGVSDGSAASAVNFVSVQGTNLAAGTAATSTNAATLFKFTGIGRFLKFSGSGASVTKLLVRLYKIH